MTGRVKSKARAVAVVVIVAAALAIGLWRWQEAPVSLFTLRGETMGTTYAVVGHGAGGVNREDLHDAIEARLREINRTFSTWDEGSEISRVNRAAAGKPIPVSAEFRAILATALTWSEATGGAFDPTIGPLVNLWGFGPGEGGAIPSRREIESVRGRVGYRHLSIEGGHLIKAVEGMYLDLSAIVKGYAVDELAKLLRGRAIPNFLVEIGGEIVAQGSSAPGQSWSIGVEVPEEDLRPGEALIAVVGLEEGALATSGSYRRFKRYAENWRHHIIDPRTGESTPSPLVAVTVHAPNCISADAAATSLMVMGVEAGLPWVERREGMEALFLTARPGGGFVQHASSGFGRLVVSWADP